MDAKKFLLGTIAGTVTSFIASFLLFGLALNSYMGAHTLTGSGKAVPDYLWLILGHIFFSAAVTYIFLKWSGIRTLSAGLTGGFIIGLLISLGYDFTMFGTTNLFSSVSIVLVDGVASAVIWAVGGAGVGWALGLGATGEHHR